MKIYNSVVNTYLEDYYEVFSNHGIYEYQFNSLYKQFETLDVKLEFEKHYHGYRTKFLFI